MKLKTRWIKQKNLSTIGQRCFSDEIGGFFTIKKIQKCKEYCKNAATPDGSRWFTQHRAVIVTDSGLKYIVPYTWLLFHSVDENGEKMSD